MINQIIYHVFRRNLGQTHQNKKTKLYRLSEFISESPEPQARFQVVASV